jgi:hypothetical protein
MRPGVLKGQPVHNGIEHEVRTANTPSCLTPHRDLTDRTVHQHHKIDQITRMRPAEQRRKTRLGA